MNLRVIAFIILSTLSLAAPARAHEGHDGAGHGATTTDGQPGNAAEAKRTVRVDALDDTFSVKEIRVRAGETVRFIVTNKSYEPHEFAIASPQEQEEHRAMMKQMPNMVHHDPNVVTVNPGETKELVWKFGKDTNVTFACNIPGHAERGMQGVFRVTP